MLFPEFSSEQMRSRVVGIVSQAIDLNPIDCGLEVSDLATDAGFLARRLHDRDISAQIEGMRRLAQAFVTDPGTVLQELVDVAVCLCGADSAGISVEMGDGDAERSEDHYYRWLAAAGQYGMFIGAMLPRWPSACGICLDRDEPQLVRVTQRFFDITGIVAAPVTDGMLLPWQVDETRGTIWILAHGRNEAFDGSDLRLMQAMADFAALGMQQQRRQDVLVEQASAGASAEMARHVAQQMHTPLQSLTSLAYLAVDADLDGAGSAMARELSGHVDRLSVLVKELLAMRRAAMVED